MNFRLFIEPQCPQWSALLSRASQHDGGAIAGKTLAEWKAITRRELGLAVDRPIIATGHQTLLWHPGILAKYLAVDAFARRFKVNGREPATANLIVDQHADGFGTFEIPVRRADGSLDIKRVELTPSRPGVPMGMHEPFDPGPAPKWDSIEPALPSVRDGVKAIYRAVSAHRDAPNAALQMAGALNDLMRLWVRPMPPACATEFIKTSFGRALLQKMVEDPQQCARLYNEAVRAVPEAGIGTLLIRDDYVELPLWLIREDGTRAHAYDGDVESMFDGNDIKLMPRALFMTAMLRVVVCDLFVHGRGGANYDRAMEIWVRSWLGVEPHPIAVVSADVRLPLREEEEHAPSVENAIREYRRLWHNPGVGDVKQEYIKMIAGAPRRSAERKQLFLAMHEKLEIARQGRTSDVERAAGVIEIARRSACDRAIAGRRDWAFPLYPRENIDGLAGALAERLGCAAGVQ